jgi:hypothetical protein
MASYRTYNAVHYFIAYRVFLNRRSAALPLGISVLSVLLVITLTTSFILPYHIIKQCPQLRYQSISPYLTTTQAPHPTSIAVPSSPQPLASTIQILILRTTVTTLRPITLYMEIASETILVDKKKVMVAGGFDEQLCQILEFLFYYPRFLYQNDHLDI